MLDYWTKLEHHQGANHLNTPISYSEKKRASAGSCFFFSCAPYYSIVGVFASIICSDIIQKERAIFVEFAQRLKSLMDERGYTNYRLAKLLDCSQSTVAHWLDGSTKPQRATMKRIAQQFGVSVESLSGKEKPAAQGDGLDDLGTMLKRHEYFLCYQCFT